jgi:TIR domain
MPWHTVFISHSTKSTDSALYLKAVSEALEAKGIEFRLDQIDLQGGDSWRQKIYRWMAEAHGAVLLLSREALESGFVPIEASILAWRAFLQKDFVFVPVLVGDVTPEDLDGGIFDQLLLREYHLVRAESPEQVAQKVIESLQRLVRTARPRTPLQHLEAGIVKYMEEGRATEADMYELGATHLGWEGPPPLGGMTLCERFARDLLSADISTAYDVLLELKKYRHMNNAASVLDIIVPFWVSEDAARPIAQYATDCLLNKPVISLNGSDPWTARTYISRSCYQSYENNIPICEIEPPQRSATSADVKEQVFKYMRKRKLAGPRDPDSLKKFIRRHRDRRIPVFLLFTTWTPDAELLGELITEFETVVFFVLTGDRPPILLAPLREQVHHLTALDREREEEALNDYSVVESQLRRASETRSEK